MKIASVLGPVLLASTLAAAQTPTVAQLAGRVDRFYNSLTTLKADFVENYRGLGMQRVESGVVWFRQPGKMRWEYRQPAAKYFVTDGRTAWFYVPTAQEARKAPVKKLDDLRSPLRYLLGKTKLQKEFEGLSFAPDAAPATPGNLVLRGVPKALADRVEQVLLEINANNQIERIVIDEVDGSKTEFRFANIQANVAAADSLFRSPVPRGVQVVETADLTPE